MRCPFVSGHDARDDVERPDAVDIGAIAIDRESNAHGHDGRIDRLAARLQIVRLELGEVVEQGLGRRTGRAVRTDQFVVGLVIQIAVQRQMY